MGVAAPAGNVLLFRGQQRRDTRQRRRLRTGVDATGRVPVHVVYVASPVNQSAADQQIPHRVADICQLQRVQQPCLIGCHGWEFSLLQGRRLLIVKNIHRGSMTPPARRPINYTIISDFQQDCAQGHNKNTSPHGGRGSKTPS